MALKQVILNKKIEDKQNEVDLLREKTIEFETRERELEDAINEASTDEERRVLEDAVDKYTQERDAHDNAIARADEELKSLRAELEDVNKKEPKNKERKEEKMWKRSEVELEEVRSGINRFVKSKGQERDGFTYVDGGILIPEEFLTPVMIPNESIDLRKYVKVVSVNSSIGKYPVITKANGKMNTVEELAQNPELSNPVVSEIDYGIETRRGYIPVSQEIIDDANYDVVGLISEEINLQSLNTSNESIASILKLATAKNISSIDDLKDLVNKDIKKVYPVKFFISASLYAELDKLKDKNGRYLLQDSIVAQSGKMLLGREVVVLDDDVIGDDAGDMVGFVGDASSFVTYFDRHRTSVEWIDNQIYGKLLAGIVRYDVKETDSLSGFYITYTPESESGDTDEELGEV